MLYYQSAGNSLIISLTKIKKTASTRNTPDTPIPITSRAPMKISIYSTSYPSNARIMAPATMDPICPATLAPIAGISTKLVGSSF
jgi:hypothetical protein